MGSWAETGRRRSQMVKSWEEDHEGLVGRDMNFVLYSITENHWKVLKRGVTWSYLLYRKIFLFVW